MSLRGRREEQQDAVLVRELGDATLIVVADGMGGCAGGAMASALAVRAFEDAAPELSTSSASEWLDSAAHRANRAIVDHAAADAELSGMGTTLVAAVVREDRAWVIHAGDSRAWIVTPTEVTALTRDHSVLQDAIDRGLVDREAEESGVYAHALLRCVGEADFVGPDHLVQGEGLEMPDDSILLLSTDGAHGYLYPADLAERLGAKGTLREALRDLARLALARGSADNITLAALEYGRYPRSRLPASGIPPISLAVPPRRDSKPRSRLLRTVSGLLVAVSLCVIVIAALRTDACAVPPRAVDGPGPVSAAGPPAPQGEAFESGPP